LPVLLLLAVLRLLAILLLILRPAVLRLRVSLLGVGARRAACDRGRTRGATPASTTVVLSTPSCWTSANSFSAFAGSSRTQPCEAGEPSRLVSRLPWIAWPFWVKKIENGIGASSHSFEKWSRSMRKALNLPFGVS
jgi:hypothetical protein